MRLVRETPASLAVWRRRIRKSAEQIGFWLPHRAAILSDQLGKPAAKLKIKFSLVSNSFPDMSTQTCQACERSPPSPRLLLVVRREPLFLPFCALAFGVLLATFTQVPLTGVALPFGISAVSVLLSASVPHLRRLRLGASCCLLLCAGAATQIGHRPGARPKLDIEDGEMAILPGCVVNPPVFSPGRAHFTLELKPNVRARVSVALQDGERLPLQYGQSVEVTGKVRVPRNFGNPDAFDYSGFLAAQHIYWTASAGSPGQAQVVSGSCGSAAMVPVYAVRDWALGRLRALYPNDPHTAGLLAATLLGETAGVERRWTQDFRVTGTYHALVISGQHISIVAGCVLLLMTVLRVRRAPARFTAAAVIWSYALVTGMSAPANRAAAGFTFFLIASLVHRRTRILNILAGIGIFYLLIDPAALLDPSFQLSFLSAAAIGGFAVPAMERWTVPVRAAVKRFDQVRYDPKVEARAAALRVELRLLAETIHYWSRISLKRVQATVTCCARAYAFVGDIVLISACIQFGLALPMIAYFHRLSVTGLTANIIVVPLLLMLIPLGFAAILTGFGWLASAAGLLLAWSDAIASWHAQFEPNWRMVALPVQAALAFCVVLACFGFAIRRQNRLFVLASAACAFGFFAVICYQPWKPVLASGWLEITAIDVSQGDCILVVFPNGKTMLIDAGGFPGLERMAHKPQIDMGEDVVAPYLWSRRIRHLDYVALSHGHSDHMAGLPAILDDFRPAELWIGPEPRSTEWGEVARHARLDQVQVRSLRRGWSLPEIGGVAIRVLAPEPDYVPGDKAVNDDSLVLEMTYGKRSALFEGDAEFPSEEAMLDSGELKPVTLLKVGHHGSKTSSGEPFLDAIQPQYAIISDGYQNQFHHPHPVTLAHLATRGIRIFRTDQNGLIQFRTNGDKVEIHTFR